MVLFFLVSPLMVIAIMNNDFNYALFILGNDFNIQNPQIALAFHTQAIKNASSSLQETVQSVDLNLNKTKQSLQNNDTTQAFSYLQTAQQQLTHLKNFTQLESIYSALLQSVISSPSSMLSHSQSSGSESFRSPSPSETSPVIPTIPRTQPPSSSILLSTPNSVHSSSLPPTPPLPPTPEATSSTSASPHIPDPPVASFPSTAQRYSLPTPAGSSYSSDLDALEPSPAVSSPNKTTTRATN